MRLISLFLLVLVSACADTPKILESTNVPLVQNAPMPMPSQMDMSAGVRPYFIGPFDTLSIDVFGIEDLDREEVQIDASGRLSFPLIGVVEAAGKTPAELAAMIEQGLRGKYVRNPQVTVNLKETVSQVITVDGSVMQPGLYPAIGRMTLIRAVATAGGLSEFADLQDVVVFRTLDGQRMAGLYNLEAIRTGVYDDPELFANDVVIVGNSESRRLFSEALQVAPLFTSPLLILLQGRN